MANVKNDPNTLMRRARAAVAYCGTSNDPGVEMAAFMALFHPEASEEKVRAVVQDARDAKAR